jgi:hypothetical protein
MYDSIEAIERVTHTLDSSPLRCPKCKQAPPLVSHGFVYKYFSSKDKMKVGKRLWCSYRYGRSGCGATVRLYMAEIIPRHRYTATELTIFLVTLISSLSISTAYKAATNSDEPRNAYRWIAKLKQNLSTYRTLLNHRTDYSTEDLASIPAPLRNLVPTLVALKEKLGDAFCPCFQSLTQSAFF